MSSSFIPHSLEEDKRVTDSPASIGINPYVFFIFCGNFVGISIPFQPAFFKFVGYLDERNFHMQPRLCNGIADGFPELRDDHLVCLRNDVERIKEND